MAVIKTENLTFTYPDGKSEALKNVNMEINEGELVLLMGKTGSGKSTLLSLLKKELAPSGTLSGTIENNAASTAFVIQNPELSFVAHKVRGELAFALENKQLGNDEIALKIGEISSYFNINELLDSTLDSLSGGEKAIVSVAASMINSCELLIMDEPFSQLDAKSAQELISMIKRLNQELGVTVIISCHSCDGIVDICDRMIVLDNGSVIEDNKPSIAAQRNDILGFFPLYTSLFEQRPLSVKESIPLASSLKEKKYNEQPNSEAVINAKRICFAYGRNERDILSSLSLSVSKGSIHSIIGANGCGKSTLLKVLAGIKKCYSGRLTVNGKTAYMPQDVRYLFTKETVAEEISADTAVRFGLDKVLSQHPYDLSGGQMQLLALALLSEQSYDILLLDEPTRGLDYSSKRSLMSYLNLLKSQGKTIIVVSHDIDFVAEASDCISFLSDGIIAITGDKHIVLSSLDFFTSSVRRVTRKYLNSAVAAEDLI